MAADDDGVDGGMLVHATAVAVAPAAGGLPQAVLITGASGSGKSSLGLQLMALGAGLVADDRVLVRRAGGGLVVGCPAGLRGLIEARGVGLLRATGPGEAVLALCVDLDRVETARLPALHLRDMMGISLPTLHKRDTPAFPAAIVQYLHMGRNAPQSEAMTSERPNALPEIDRAARQQRVVLVSGPSGAGRSTAINRLEDLGFESIDNLPLSLVPRLLDGGAGPQPLALGIDVRNREFSANAMIDLIDGLTRRPEVALELLYLDCSVERLLARFSETRRRHPLAPEETPLVGIEAERDLLAPIRARADVLIDTSDLSPHDLGAEVARWFDRGGGAALAVSVQSFSYKRGLPRGVDMVFDCRFLSNPHWQAALRPLDGRDGRVAAHVARDGRYAPFLGHVLDLMRLLLPAQLEEGKSHLSIAFGCTGGRHRSVVLAEQVAAALASEGWQVSKRHRELERQGAVGAAEAWTGLGS